MDVPRSGLLAFGENRGNLLGLRRAELARSVPTQTIMQDAFDSTDRNTADFILFALGFIGFVVGAGGVVVASLATALFGGLLMLFAISSFLLRSYD